ncbi:cryptochrome/photolyase family protein [Crocosphaera sp. XPORK-15E]|uniref:cryptochrome/photolyase family protein n=1 Tax=Crocosphaera sp. XPORK-15E TaxID=3110247 RepID=UPI002B20D6FC|nr:cryptochrome/photolyase family protein [Crocosphaera sp. XPORK-15E]MEA5537337.1 cryptochrome/photolyase family protein [Crocosphaera sp. XPORK-15E]
MRTGIWVLGDQLWMGQAALNSCEHEKINTPVIIIESHNYAQKRPYHRQKLVLVWSAMRHFAAELRSTGWLVTYSISDDFETALLNWIKENRIDEVRIMSPNDRPFTQLINNLQLGCSINLIPNNHFLWSVTEFKEWANSRKRLLLEDFYREGRKRFNILVEENKPIGGKWNFDQQNRQPPKGKLKTPQVLWFEPDEITNSVIEEIKALSWTSYGEIEPFKWGVSRSNAKTILEHFIRQCLPTFGPYQDAMITGENSLWHSLISPYLNLGLLTPIEVIEAAQLAYFENNLDLNSVEGFIRQVLGWREYMNGIYHYVDEDYRESNWFNHNGSLPNFYWQSSQTDMNCLHQVLNQVEKTGYAHHIQRLMVLSNFALIVGVSPQKIESWFQAAFVDAYDWVMVPNVIGMGQFADGGILGSKPYASSANYLNKMSDYCGNCVYDYKQKIGEKACPFNFFYWDFLDRHQEQIKSLGRMNFVLGHLNRLKAEEINEIRALAVNWRENNCR